MITRRSILGGALGVAGATMAHAQSFKFFSIMTGGTAGIYFPIGGLIADAISRPPGSGPCKADGPCGVTGLVATTVVSNGSVANVTAIGAGSAQSGFVQSDVAYWAYTGTGIYENRPKIDTLRAIANLYPESIHLVARKGLGIRSVADLRGRRVSIDESGSGTLVDARMILAAYGLSEKDLKLSYLSAQHVGDKFRDNSIDAFFSVSGWPQSTIADLAANVGIDLVPVAGPQAAKLTEQHKFFVADEIPLGAYKGVAGVKTISVRALWITSSKQPDELIYQVTAALWNPGTRRLLDSGPARGRDIRPENALVGVGIPLHPGAEKFYKERKLME
jgi:uncharacterized protein